MRRGDGNCQINNWFITIWIRIYRISLGCIVFFVLLAASVFSWQHAGRVCVLFTITSDYLRQRWQLVSSVAMPDNSAAKAHLPVAAY